MTGFPIAPVDHFDEREHRRLLAEVINRVMAGKINARGEFTLRSSQATTTLSDQRIGAESHFSLMATTANAAAEMNTIYVSSRDQGVAVFTHINDADADKTFSYAVLG